MATKGTMKFTTYQRCTLLIKNRFKKINETVDALLAKGEPPSQVELRNLGTYSKEINSKRSEFDKNLHRVLELSAEDASEEELTKDQDEIYDLFTIISGKIDSLLPEPDPTTPLSQHSGTGFPGQLPQLASVRLPQLELIKFSGQPIEWISFSNMFDSAIHQNATLSNVAKFQYLKSVLSGEPLNLIKSLSYSASNYIVAYNLLKDRYHSPRRLTAIHLYEILDLPHITSSSTKLMRAFVNAFHENTQALKMLDCDISTENPLLSALILRKMDTELRKRFESYRSVHHTDDNPDHGLPQVQEILKFLNEECVHTEEASIHTVHGSQSSGKTASHSASFHKSSDKKRVQFSSSAHNTALMATTPQNGRFKSDTQNATCFACNKSGHKVYFCSTYKTKNPKQRYQLVKDNHRCVSCLGNHTRTDCKSTATCFVCHKKHHTTLHFDVDQNSGNAHTSQSSNLTDAPVVTSQNNQNPAALDKADPNKSAVSMTSQYESPMSQTISLKAHTQSSTVLLGTTLLKLTAKNGTTHILRGLLDTGSMTEFISERAAQLLGVTRHRTAVNIVGIGHTTSQTKGFTELNIASLSGHVIANRHPFHILDKISAELPRTQLAPDVLSRVKNYTLADPTFHIPGSIDVLIGGALYPQLLTQETYSLGPHMPSIIGTKLGYIVMGTARCDNAASPTSYHASMLSTNDFDLHSSLMRFWEQEQPPICKKQSEEEQQCDEHFIATHSRDSDGRYIVRLPFKANHPPLGSSQISAERRFQSLEHKFRAQPHFHDLYSKFMEEYNSQGHMTKLSNFDANSPHYFLPHHGVLKAQSSSTKLRAVFDGSNKTSTGISLNEILQTGPKLQAHICDILLNFRTHNVVFSADIRAMYRQIKVHPDDCRFQLILWRDHPSQDIGVYQLNTVTYGLNSSPYQAIRTLCQLADDEGSDYPEAAQVLKSQTYVDDIISGADSVEQALKLQQQLIELLKRGCFELRKWSSNATPLLQAVPKEHLETPVFLEASQQPHFSILGIHWSPSSDTFTYNINLPHDTPTKRSVLSIIAKIYDPCGFLAPCVMLAKCFMQLLWASGLNWDEKLPEEMAQKWLTFVSDAKAITQIQIPRALQLSQSNGLELHGFSDASESGFAAVIYFRCQLSNGDVIVRQVLAKTRVAPLKRVTLPRLELCAAHLLAQLVTYVFSIFNNKIDFANTYLWCDSSVVLTWLQTPSYRLKTFVANRVSQTQELIPSHCWRYIESASNPADVASRGILASQLLEHPLWWTGPKWITLPQCNWPARRFAPVDINSSEETKTTPLTVLTSTQPIAWELLSRFSSWKKLQYVMAFVLRFVHNCKQPEKRHGFLSVQELEDSKLKIFKLVQQLDFKDDLDQLKKHRSCSTRLQRLSPFLDSQGLLRVGGRLSGTTLPDDARHPVILPKHHHVVHLFIDHCHLTHLHAGPQLTQALLHNEVWILSARSVIRSRIFKCVKCFKTKPRNNTPLMGDLPRPRVTPARPFLLTGTDYCGPFTVKVFNLKAVRQVKVYICVFVCLVTKAVHLEVVTDLTSESFISTLTRFVSRRGLCSDIYSDCGTNYVGADSTLRKLLDSTIFSADQQKKIQHFAAPQGIKFHFNPPTAAHQGGLWEAAVKSSKYHLRRVMGETVLTLMELVTLTTQIEAMLNSRPLTPISSDPSDFTALTPGHFLIGAPLTAVPEPDLHDVPDNRLKRWQLVQSFNQRIWRRWQLEYLHTLQQRLKWTQHSKNLKVGDLVLIHNNTSSPLTWPLARVSAVHPGSDGVVRVVDLKTQNGTFTRPAVKVFPLPID